jgi:hypothetical protein
LQGWAPGKSWRGLEGEAGARVDGGHEADCAGAA